MSNLLYGTLYPLRLSFLPASPNPPLLIIRLRANRRLIAPPYYSPDLHLLVPPWLSELVTVLVLVLVMAMVIVMMIAFLYILLLQIASCQGCIGALVAFVWLSPVCIGEYCFNWPGGEDAKLHWVQMLGFSPVCIFKCALQAPRVRQAVLHWLHLFNLFSQCVFKCVFKLLAQYDA